MNRDEKIVNAVTTEGFTYKGVLYKALTPRGLLILEKHKSPFFSGGSALKGLFDYLYVCSQEPKAVQSISLDDWDDIIYDYADQFTQEDLAELGRLSKEFNEIQSSTIVEAKKVGEKKQDTAQ